MELTEEQICLIIRKELRKILDAGLMYTAEAKPQPKPEPKPEKKGTITGAEILFEFPEELRKHLKAEEYGKVIRTEFVSRECWEQINEVAKKLGFKWVPDGKASRWEKEA